VRPTTYYSKLESWPRGVKPNASSGNGIRLESIHPQSPNQLIPTGLGDANSPRSLWEALRSTLLRERPTVPRTRYWRRI